MGRGLGFRGVRLKLGFRVEALSAGVFQGLGFRLHPGVLGFGFLAGYCFEKL